MSAPARSFTLPARDGFPLAATEFGEAASARAAVLIVPAMGVPQRHYAAFAAWLAQQGCYVVTFDYRGMAASRPAAHRRSLRGFDADVTTWATQDAAAAVDHVAARARDGHVLWIGHSLGGQILGLVPNRDRVRAMLTIATGSGYWRENAPPLRWYVGWLWFVAAPLSMRLCGYFPGRALRMVGDLPEGVMRQWRRWCLHPDYVAGAEGADVRDAYATVRTPIVALSFTDDEYMSARNTLRLHEVYRAAPREHVRIAPEQVGVRRIGHFGFFGRTHGERLWPLAHEWIRRHVGVGTTAADAG